MKAFRSSISACIFLALLHFHGAAAEEPSVDAILDKYVAAIGGKAAWEKLSSRSIVADMEAAGTTTDWKYTGKAPDKQFTVVDFPGLGMLAEGVDGAMAWAKDANGVRTKEGEDAARAKREAQFNFEIRMKGVYPDLSVKGSEKSDDEETIVLQAKPDASGLERFFFSRKSGLLVRHLSEFKNDTTAVQIDRHLNEYREIDRVKLPHLRKIHISIDGQEIITFSLKIKELKHNLEIQDSKFVRPSE